MEFKSKILRDELIPVRLLDGHEQNWRVHPEAQERAMRAVLERIGWIGKVVVRELPGGRYQIINGHLRAKIAAGDGEDAEVPCTVVDLSDAEAKAALATFDAIAMGAEIDPGAVRELMEGMDGAKETIQLLGISPDDIPSDLPVIPEVTIEPPEPVDVKAKPRGAEGENAVARIAVPLLAGDKAGFIEVEFQDFSKWRTAIMIQSARAGVKPGEYLKKLLKMKG